MPELTDVAWLAGLYEGEGTLVRRVDKRHGTVTWELSLSSTDIDVIVRAKAVAAVGYISFVKRQKPHWSDKHSWRVSRRDDIAAVLTMMMPWLCARRAARAQEFLDWYSPYA